MTSIGLLGIDLAWKIDKNPSGLAFGSLSGKVLTLDAIVHEVFPTVQDLANTIESHGSINGIAIDAPLIVKNLTKQRPCESLIGIEYGARHAACHSTNLTQNPSPQSVVFSKLLESQGYGHLSLQSGKWQIECYPHPALIEIFDLKERHKYKKGSVQDRKDGQIDLGKKLLLQLKASSVLSLVIPDDKKYHFTKSHIDSLSGKSLKGNEDILDAIICLYIAGLYSLFPNREVFGDIDDGYIYVPRSH
jgi:predicted RNase H-like nuclease